MANESGITVPELPLDLTPAGRPTRFSAAVCDRLVQAFRMGATKEMACNYAQISYSTYRNWQVQVMTQDPKAEYLAEKAALFDKIAEATAEASIGWLTRIELAARDPAQWRAAAWKLERIYPKQYGPKSQVDVYAETADTTQSLEVVRETYDLSRLSDEDLERLEQILAPVKEQVTEVIEGESREL